MFHPYGFESCFNILKTSLGTYYDVVSAVSMRQGGKPQAPFGPKKGFDQLRRGRADLVKAARLGCAHLHVATLFWLPSWFFNIAIENGPFLDDFGYVK